VYRSPNIIRVIKYITLSPTVNSSVWATEKTFQQPTRPADVVEVLTKNQKELT
jgi:hypothetical protein